MTLLAALGYSVSRNIAHCLHGSRPLCTGRLRDEVFCEVDVEAARIVPPSELHEHSSHLVPADPSCSRRVANGCDSPSPERVTGVAECVGNFQSTRTHLGNVHLHQPVQN